MFRSAAWGTAASVGRTASTPSRTSPRPKRCGWSCPGRPGIPSRSDDYRRNSMTIDHEAANAVLAGLRPFPVAVTTIDDGFDPPFLNGLMSLSAGADPLVSLVPPPAGRL